MEKQNDKEKITNMEWEYDQKPQENVFVLAWVADLENPFAWNYPTILTWSGEYWKHQCEPNNIHNQLADKFIVRSWAYFNAPDEEKLKAENVSGKRKESA